MLVRTLLQEVPLGSDVMARGVGARKKEETSVRGYFRGPGGKGAALRQQLGNGEKGIAEEYIGSGKWLATRESIRS